MRLKDLLVHIDGTEPGRVRLGLAVELARQHGAHLTGLHVIDIPPPSVVVSAGGGYVVVDMLEAMRREARAAAARLETEFRDRAQREGLAGEWRLAEGLAPERIALHARYADLVILGQEDPAHGPPGAAAIIEQALFSSGRPVLVVPAAGRFATPGRRVLVGWNASREAARAVNDALPLIAGAEAVGVLAINPRCGIGGHGDAPGADIALHLARHGLNVVVEHTAAEGLAEGDVLLNRAAELGADLMVVGAYGHSRFRETILGGVTRTLLRSMTVPVLMSH